MSTVWSLSNVNVNEFLKLLEACKGDVYMVTDEGDRLNLQSQLCRLIGLSKLVEGGMIANASLVCENVEDEGILVRYKLYRTIDAPKAETAEE